MSVRFLIVLFVLHALSVIYSVMLKCSMPNESMVPKYPASLFFLLLGLLGKYVPFSITCLWYALMDKSFKSLAYSHEGGPGRAPIVGLISRGIRVKPLIIFIGEIGFGDCQQIRYT